jgi:hypothetical protein
MKGRVYTGTSSQGTGQFGNEKVEVNNNSQSNFEFANNIQLNNEVSGNDEFSREEMKKVLIPIKF